MNSVNKWGRDYWVDLSERVGSTLIYGLITLLTTTSIIDVTPELGWTIVGLPAVLSALKGLLVNMGGEEPSASVANVTSYGEAA